MKKILVLFVLIPLLQSCQYFEKNVPNKEELLQKELEKINWSEVDEYPSTISCDSISDKYLRKHCFFDFITKELHLKLNNDTIRNFYKKQDTLQVKLLISADAMVTFETKFETDSLPFNRQKADSVLQFKLSNFPSLEPAIKRGTKVKSEFIVPVILSKN
jgi:hypothetical protein